MALKRYERTVWVRVSELVCLGTKEDYECDGRLCQNEVWICNQCGRDYCQITHRPGPSLAGYFYGPWAVKDGCCADCRPAYPPGYEGDHYPGIIAYESEVEDLPEQAFRYSCEKALDQLERESSNGKAEEERQRQRQAEVQQAGPGPRPAEHGQGSAPAAPVTPDSRIVTL